MTTELSYGMSEEAPCTTVIFRGEQKKSKPKTEQENRKNRTEKPD